MSFVVVSVCWWVIQWERESKPVSLVDFVMYSIMYM